VTNSVFTFGLWDLAAVTTDGAASGLALEQNTTSAMSCSTSLSCASDTVDTAHTENPAFSSSQRRVSSNTGSLPNTKTFIGISISKHGGTIPNLTLSPSGSQSDTRQINPVFWNGRLGSFGWPITGDTR
jgi:hypothetical protein